MRAVLYRAIVPIVFLVAAASVPTREKLIADVDGTQFDAFTFNRKTTSEQDHKTEVTVEHHDLRATPVWTLVSVDGGPPKPKVASNYARRMGGAKPSADNGLGKLLAAAQQVDATHYHLAILPAGTFPGRGQGFQKHLIGDLVVDADGPKPFIKSVRLFAPKPFSGSLGTTSTEYELTTTYTLGADGRTRLQSSDVRYDIGTGGFVVGTASISGVRHTTHIHTDYTALAD